MKKSQTMRSLLPCALSTLVLLPTLLACSGAEPSTQPSPDRSTEKVVTTLSFHAPAGSRCFLDPEEGSNVSGKIPLLVEEDGLARFILIHPPYGEIAPRVFLDCVDPTGIPFSHPVELPPEATLVTPAMR